MAIRISELVRALSTNGVGRIHASPKLFASIPGSDDGFWAPEHTDREHERVDELAEEGTHLVNN